VKSDARPPARGAKEGLWISTHAITVTNATLGIRATVFTRGLNLPRGREREIVHDARDREYTLRGSESRSLATVGAFRVVPARDLRDRDDRPGDPPTATSDTCENILPKRW
jgi:hypothetical protein